MENKKYFIIRNGELVHVWKFNVTVNGFETYLFIRGTETEVKAYFNSEYPENYSDCRYHACTDSELLALQTLKAKIYCAPEM